MKNIYVFQRIILLSTVVLVACQSSENNQPLVETTKVDLNAKPETKRWYTQAQVNEGRKLFAQYCATCHGTQAEATPDWKTPTKDGNYPPPPLNGTAHAWHHPLSVLDQVISQGGKPVGGVMPAWGNVLNAQQRLHVIASFQSYWPDDIYATWLEREKASRE